MITLTPITEPAQLEEYFKFRYRIYSESRQAGFLNASSDGRDMDAFDSRALHFGWYMNGVLAGCVRFVEPADGEDALPMLSYMSAPGLRDAVLHYIAKRRFLDERMVEASRFCLDQTHRGMRTSKAFVSAMSETLHELGIDRALFDCLLRHAPFYRCLGFEVLEGAECFQVPRTS